MVSSESSSTHNFIPAHVGFCAAMEIPTNFNGKPEGPKKARLYPWCTVQHNVYILSQTTVLLKANLSIILTSQSSK